MYRCASFAASAAAFLAATVLCIPAQAQVQRQFPANALRGMLVIGQSPAATLNGQPATMAPGSRLRGDTNFLLQPASLMGQKLLVHYTLDPTGQLMDVWVLNPTEAANKPWPRSPQEAAKWTFDAASQTWTKG